MFLLSTQLRRQSTSRTRIVEWIIVSDYEQVSIHFDCSSFFYPILVQFIANDGNESATVMRALEVANRVDSVSYMLSFLKSTYSYVCFFSALQKT